MVTKTFAVLMRFKLYVFESLVSLALLVSTVLYQIGPNQAKSLEATQPYAVMLIWSISLMVGCAIHLFSVATDRRHARAGGLCLMAGAEGVYAVSVIAYTGVVQAALVALAVCLACAVKAWWLM